MNDDNELLRRYAEEGSEAAFTELTRRHLNLVYSAALRQLDGNTHLAEEVSQTVFTELARKARKLSRHSSLAGWLFTVTRYTAMNSRRSESRRHAREQKMEFCTDRESDHAWQELRPVLDEAMHDLSERDREGLLLRFFEEHALAEVGQHWGITENAARMRIDRALEKLRCALEKRGVQATGAGLCALISAKSVIAAPVHLHQRIASHALSFKPAALKVSVFPCSRALQGLVALMALILISVFMVRPSRLKTGAGVGSSVEPAGQGAIPAVNSRAPFSAAGTPGTPRNSNAGLEELLTVPAIEILTVNAETGQPMPNIALELLSTDGEKWKKESFVTSDQGLVRIPYSNQLTTFDLLTRGDGHANKRLLWHPDRGDTIPDHYTLRLSRPVQIGGQVLDPDGAPVADATVSFGHPDTPELANAVESSSYRYAETKTDSLGRWQMNRIAPEMLADSSGAARHPDFIEARVELKENPAEIEKLTHSTHIFRLGRTLAVRGFVRNEAGQAVAGAIVSAGHFATAGRRETTTGSDGSFLLPKVTPGPSFLSASADGYAPATIKVEVRDTDGPYELVLKRGKTLRFHVIDPEGNGIGGALLRLDNMFTDLGRHDQPRPADIQVEVNLTADAEGRALWTNAPDLLLAFSASAKGYMYGPSVLVHPGDEEHVVTLHHAVTIKGNVRNEAGDPIERYRIRIGWPEPVYGTGQLVPRWSDIDRFLITFSRPQFEYTMQEPVVLAPENRGYFFKFEAEGYKPWLSQLISAKEPEVQLDVILQVEKPEKLRIEDSSGQPVLDAPVLFLPEGRFVNAGPGGFLQMVDSLPEVRTDAKGEVPMKYDPELTRVVVACSSGVLDLPVLQIPPDHIVRLKQWGRVEGKILREGAPSPGETVIFARPENLGAHGQLPRPIPPVSFNVDPVRTREDGSFTFEKVPPGESFVIVVRHKLAPDGRFLEAVHESKTPVTIDSVEPVELALDLPASELSKPKPFGQRNASVQRPSRTSF